MKKIKIAFTALLMVLFALFSCNDPSIIGSDLLADEQLGIEFTDTLTLKAKTIYGDTVRTFVNLPAQLLGLASQPTRYFLGEMEDPVFGKYRSELFLQFQIAFFNGVAVPPSFTGGTLDSIFLVLPYDTTGWYGRVAGEDFFTTVRLASDNDFDNIEDYYSKEEINYSDVLAFEVSYTPSTDSVEVIAPPTDTLLRRVAQARVPLNNNYFTNKFFDESIDTTVFENDTLFQNYFEGVGLLPTNVTPGLAAFSIQTTNRVDLAGLEVFYTDKNGEGAVYFFPVDAESVRFNTFAPNYEGSLVEEYEAGGFERGDSLVFIQGLEGVDFEIEITNADFRQDIVVNKAELILPLAVLDEDDSTLYPPLGQLIIGEVLEDGTSALISDVRILLDIGVSLQQLATNFGGVVVDDSYYSMNITDHFQDMLNGSASNTLRILPLERSTRSARSVIAGPGHGDTPMKLNLSFTVID